jgi:hypothetical protein
LVWQPTGLPCGVFLAPLLSIGLELRKRSFLNEPAWFCCGVFATVVVPLAGVPALADRKFPSKPIRLVVPFAPGSGSDFVGRALGREGAPASRHACRRKPELAGRGIGGVAVARAKPDGHTLLVAATTTFVLEMLLKRVSGSTAGRWASYWSFFDEISQEWLILFLEHRIGDRRIIRLIQKWLKAGILEDGIVTVSDNGRLSPDHWVTNPIRPRSQAASA